MGKVYSNKQCIECGFTGQCIEIFGKYHCRKCYDAKPHKKGHSGMIYRPNIKWEDFIEKTLRPSTRPILKRVKKKPPFIYKLVS